MPRDGQEAEKAQRPLGPDLGVGAPVPTSQLLLTRTQPNTCVGAEEGPPGQCAEVKRRAFVIETEHLPRRDAGDKPRMEAVELKEETLEARAGCCV